ncbi:hypothetical protein VTN31DRAFT_6558 [Thermomyces dupontii]|uniref:uncharacterized protein n=1 Tax=Talaromyces thermophilus TaxID=28565 RepID=UPI0037448563
MINLNDQAERIDRDEYIFRTHGKDLVSVPTSDRNVSEISVLTVWSTYVLRPTYMTFHVDRTCIEITS